MGSRSRDHTSQEEHNPPSSLARGWFELQNAQKLRCSVLYEHVSLRKIIFTTSLIETPALGGKGERNWSSLTVCKRYPADCCGVDSWTVDAPVQVDNDPRSLTAAVSLATSRPSCNDGISPLIYWGRWLSGPDVAHTCTSGKKKIKNNKMTAVTVSCHLSVSL